MDADKICQIESVTDNPGGSDSTTANSQVQPKPSSESIAISHTQQNIDGDDDDDDQFSECWDDAKALLVNSGNSSKVDGLPKSKPESPIVSSNDEISNNQPSSSSAYSSFRSANNINGKNSTTTTLDAMDSHHQQNLTTGPESSADQQFDELILHKAVFNNDTKVILDLLNDTNQLKRHNLYNKRDKHGNTALHLACMLGRSRSIIEAFLSNNSNTPSSNNNDNKATRWAIDAKNLHRWTPFHEACSYGNREVIKLMAKQLSDEVEDAINNIRLSESLEKTRNYRLVLRWEFQSWVPFVSRVLPSEACVINKQGSYIRIDTRLLDFEGLFRKNGDSCIVYSNKKWIVMNNKTKKFDYFGSPNAYKDIDDRVDEFMSTDIVDLEFKSSEMQLTRSTSGWIWKADKVGKVGKYNAALYDFTNVHLIWRKRREHLSEEDLKRNKSAYKSAVHVFEHGERPNSHSNDLDDNSSIQEENEAKTNEDDGGSSRDDGGNDDHRESLPPPPPTSVTWDQYIRAEPGEYPTLGREQKCKISKKPMKASVAMSEEFPITKNEFLDLLSIVPLKMFKKLKEFVELKLPEGFPVRLDVPIFPLLTARITFEDFTFVDGPIDMSLFTVPDDYERDPNLLPGRLKGCSRDSSEREI